MLFVAQIEPYTCMSRSELQCIDVLPSKFETESYLPDKVSRTHALPREAMRPHEGVGCQPHITATMSGFAKQTTNNSLYPLLAIRAT
eukprot:3648556-Amphidinium_carterae.2